MAQEGQSAVVQDVNTHFVAFVEKEGQLYELDGRKATPINHGPTSAATLLKVCGGCFPFVFVFLGSLVFIFPPLLRTNLRYIQDAVKVVVKEFMERDPGEMRFGITALGPAMG